MSGIYLHIPFCVKKCRYCDFISFPGSSSREKYFHALKTEIALTAKSLSEESLSEKPFHTVFFGGGTPSIAPEGAISSVLDTLRKHFNVLPDAEITLESNPGTLTEEKLREYVHAGVNRLSIGLQASQNEILRRIGRIHTYEEFLSSYHMARRAGLKNINTDVMYGLPGQSLRDYLETLSALIALAPEHISAYSLILEEGTPLYEDVEAGRESVPDDDAVCDMQEAGQELLKKEGYFQYEISNYALPGCECRHNVNYWENGEYLGLGLAAHGALRRNGSWVRTENTSDLAEYFFRIKEEKLPVLNRTVIPKREEMFESVMLGLRMVRGLDLVAFRARYRADFAFAYPEAVKKLTGIGWLSLTENRAFLTEIGLRMQNAALIEFMD